METTEKTSTGDGAVVVAEPTPTELPAIAAGIQLRSLDDVIRLGGVLAKSGFFRDVRDAAQAVVKILAGAELGLGPVASMRSVHCFDGQTSLHYSLIGAMIKRHPRYDYRLARLDEAGCEILFFEDGQEIGRSMFTAADAKSAGLSNKRNWKAHTKDMLFARAMTRGARQFCPDAFNGPIYTPDELGVEVDYETGEVLEETRQAQPEPTKGDLSKRLYDTGAGDPRPQEIPPEFLDRLAETEEKLLDASTAEYAEKKKASDDYWKPRTNDGMWGIYTARIKDVEAKRSKWRAYVGSLPAKMAAAHRAGPDDWNALLERVNRTMDAMPEWWAAQVMRAWEDTAIELLGDQVPARPMDPV